MFDQLWQDLRFATRLLLKNQKLTLVLVLCLALGIGPTTTVFSLVNTIFLKPIDVEDPQALVFMQSVTGERISSLNYPESAWLNRKVEALSGITVVSGAQVSVLLPKGSELLSCGVVSDNFFDILGRPALLGDTFHHDPEAFPGRQAFLVLSHDFWVSHLGKDPQVVGRTLQVNGFDFEILGVMAPSFTGSNAAFVPQFWAPLKMIDQIRPDSTGRMQQFSHNWLMGFGRLAPGQSIASAEQELKTLAETFIEEHEQADDLRSYKLSPFSNIAGFPQDEITQAVGMMFAVVLLVLLLACVSVASILLTRGTERRNEIAIRAALGASRATLIRQLLIESVMLGIVAGLVALLVAMWCGEFIGMLLKQFSASIVLGMDLDFRVLAFTCGISAFAGLIFGLLPALNASKPDLIRALKDQPLDRAGDRGTRLLRNGFVVVQAGLSVLLLIGAGLFLKSLRQAATMDLGYESEAMVLLPVNIRLFARNDVDAQNFTSELQQDLESLPEVTQTATTRYAPLVGATSTTFIQVVEPGFESGDERIRVDYNRASTGFFETLGIEILEGRSFNAEDMVSPWRTIVINEPLARRIAKEGSALGKQVAFPNGDDTMTVIGVVRDIKNHRMGETGTPYFYAPMDSSGLGDISLLIRTPSHGSDALPAIKDMLKESYPGIALSGLNSMRDQLRQALWPARALATLFGILGLVALLLALTGVYGVVSYHLAMRRREIGIRLALGCPPALLLRQILRGGLGLVALGALLGLGLAFMATQVFASLLIGTQPRDLLVFFSVPILLVLIAFIALLPNALAFVRSTPMSSLRYD